jgi:hypothetical protein
VLSAGTGDVNGDGVVDINDALLALQIVAGIVTPTPSEILGMDVAPIISGKSAPDGILDMGDVLLILRKVLGLETRF